MERAETRDQRPETRDHTWPETRDQEWVQGWRSKYSAWSAHCTPLEVSQERTAASRMTKKPSEFQMHFGFKIKKLRPILTTPQIRNQFLCFSFQPSPYVGYVRFLFHDINYRRILWSWILYQRLRFAENKIASTSAILSANVLTISRLYCDFGANLLAIAFKKPSRNHSFLQP